MDLRFSTKLATRRASTSALSENQGMGIISLNPNMSSGRDCTCPWMKTRGSIARYTSLPSAHLVGLSHTDRKFLIVAVNKSNATQYIICQQPRKMNDMMMTGNQGRTGIPRLLAAISKAVRVHACRSVCGRESQSSKSGRW